MLQYTLIENVLTPASNDYTAHPVNIRSHNLEAIYQRIGARYPGLTPVQISAAVNEFFEEVYAIVKDGEAVNTPLFVLHWSIPGVIEGAADSIDIKRNPAKVNLYAGSALREAAKKVKCEKVIVADPQPHILEVKDVQSGSVNETLTSGGVVQLRGGRLKFLPAEESNGIFLVSENGDATKLTVIVENKPARLIAVLPADLPQGDYFIEVRTSYSASGKSMKTLKQGRYHKTLTVV